VAYEGQFGYDRFHLVEKDLGRGIGSSATNLNDHEAGAAVICGLEIDTSLVVRNIKALHGGN
jgi:hypothetical protein